MTINELSAAVLDRLKAEHLTVCTAESCTGGWLGKLLTDIPGSSQCYLGGVISYTNGVKASVLQVEQHLLDTLGPVSAPVAEQMAQGVRQLIGGDFGLSVTGLAGPDSDGSGRPVGLVYIGLASEKGTFYRQLHLAGDRLAVREQACRAVLELLLENLP